MGGGCKNDLERVKEVTAEDYAPIQTVYEAQYFYTEEGKLKTLMSAPKVDKYVGEEEDHFELPEGLKLSFFDSLEQQESQLTAEYGIWKKDKGIMEAQHNVEVMNRKGEKLNTEELVWLLDSGKVYTDKYVKITRDGGIIYGKGLVANQDFTSYTIREITGELYVDDEVQK